MNYRLRSSITKNDCTIVQSLYSTQILTLCENNFLKTRFKPDHTSKTVLHMGISFSFAMFELQTINLFRTQRLQMNITVQVPLGIYMILL